VLAVPRQLGDLPMYTLVLRDKEAWGAGGALAEIMAHIARTKEGLNVQILHLSPAHKSRRQLKMPENLRNAADAVTPALNEAGRIWKSLSSS
jgi:hypothetical protein